MSSLDMKFVLALKGSPELIREMDKLDDKTARQYSKEAVTAAAKRVTLIVAVSTPVGLQRKKSHGVGNLRKSIDYKIIARPRNCIAVIGPRKGKSEKYDGYYGIWVERGHLKRQRKKIRTKKIRQELSKTVGNMVPPHPFAGPVFNNSMNLALAEFEKVLSRLFYG